MGSRWVPHGMVQPRSFGEAGVGTHFRGRVLAGVPESGLLFWQLQSKRRSPEAERKRKLPPQGGSESVFQVSSLQTHGIKSIEMSHVQDSEVFHRTRKPSQATVLQAPGSQTPSCAYSASCSGSWPYSSLSNFRRQ